MMSNDSKTEIFPTLEEAPELSLPESPQPTNRAVLDIPSSRDAFLKKRREDSDLRKIVSDLGEDALEDELDIPAFIRRRAD
jgi:hypothetical protein